MTKREQIQLFEGSKVRTVWDDEREKWYFSIVDVVEVLTDSLNPTDYLKKMRKRDPELGGYIGTNCPQVQMTTHTGKKRLTLAADVEQLFRIIQSIPSAKAEPFKQWLARVGYERIQEIECTVGSDPFVHFCATAWRSLQVLCCTSSTSGLHCFGSHAGAMRGCIFYSLACSCREMGINFFEYLSDILN